MTSNLSSNAMPKVMVLLFAFALMSTIPTASAGFVIGGGGGVGGGGGDFEAPTFTANAITINQNNVTEGAQSDTVTASAGDTVEFVVLASDNGGADNITNLDVFLNHNGDKILNNLQETHVSFSNDDLFIQNPNGIIESATMDTENVGADMKFTFNVIFATTFDTSDVLLRSWDLSGNGSTLHLADSLKIIESTSPPVTPPVDNTPVTTDDTTDDTTTDTTTEDTVTDAIEDTIEDITIDDPVQSEMALPYSIMLGGADGTIPYDITGAMVTGAMVNLDNNSILFNLVDADNGTLTVSPSAETQKGIFMVLIDGEEANDVTINGNDVTVNFPAGTETVEIIGTFVIPEFGTVAMMILIISIISIIAITGKSRLSLRV